MRKGTVVTEQNFEAILKKLQRICNKYKMLEFYKAYDADYKEKKEYRYSSIKIRRSIRFVTDEIYRRQFRLEVSNSFTEVGKHSIREKYENKISDDYISEKIYEERKPLLMVVYASSTGISICEGDRLVFHPFKGFSIWTDNMFTAPVGAERVYYKHTFFPDIVKGKIKDLQFEIDKRRKEWEEDAEEYLAMEEEWRNQRDEDD